MNALSIPFIIDAVEESTVARLREKLGGHGPERRSPRPSPATLPTMDSARPCHVCQAEGQHDPWCTIHLADYEDMDRLQRWRPPHYYAQAGGTLRRAGGQMRP